MAEERIREIEQFVQAADAEILVDDPLELLALLPR
jgi:hypothetical protein